MDFSLQTQKSSKHRHRSQMLKGKVQLHHENQLKHQGTKSEEFVESETNSLPVKLRQDPAVGTFVRPRSSDDCARGKSAKDDELVKYMSKLPRYLQHTEKGENFHDKSFNIGVLDWSRLEKWDSVQKHTPSLSGKYAPSSSRDVSSKRTSKSSTFASAPQTKNHPQKTERRPSLDSSLNSSPIDDLSRGVKPSAQRITHFHYPESSSTRNSDWHKERPPRNYKISDRYSNQIHEHRNRKGSDLKITSRTDGLSTHWRNRTLSQTEHGSTRDGQFDKVVTKSEESDKRNKAEHLKSMLGTDDSSSKLGSGRISASSNNLKTRDKEKPESDTNLHREPKDIVLLLPKNLSRSSSSREPQTSCNEKMVKGNRISFQDGFSSEVVQSRELCAEIPHSSLLPSKVETKSRPAMTIDSQDNKFSIDTSRVTLRSSKLQDMHSNSRHVKQDSAELTLKSLDEELIELSTKKVRNSSPSRRFSFSLGRLSRSFSFKESSSLAELSSTHVSVKSGPVSSCLDDKNTEKTSQRAKSSPLRRLLDPLFRSKGPNSNLSRSVDSLQSLKENWNAKDSLQIEKPESLPGCGVVGSFLHAPRSTVVKTSSTTIQAVLQLTVKNGLPLFRFVVENDSSILAATMKSMTSPGKDDLGQHYTFYSVNEIKRKSGSWISQGSSKVKPNGYAYNVVGQMKVSSPIQNSDDLCVIRESVLLGIEVRQGDHQASHKILQNKELASIIVKMPTENGWSSCLVENQDNDSITVILPGGDHGLPINGAPSKLIDRWKSGGLCDCGGWDVGCRLRVLSNQSQYSKISRTSHSCRKSDCFQLFHQGETQESRPFISLAPRTQGIYSVEFNSSASSLQAFFICVVVMSNRKLSDLSEMGYLSEGKAFQGPQNVPENMTTKTPFLDEVAVKYPPNPPLSPVGRV
ncbi:hypothetical protein ACFE04_002444 [Oxalis oulophora]